MFPGRDDNLTKTFKICHRIRTYYRKHLPDAHQQSGYGKNSEVKQLEKMLVDDEFVSTYHRDDRHQSKKKWNFQKFSTVMNVFNARDNYSQ